MHGYNPAQRPRFVATYLLETPTDRLRRATAIEGAWASHHRETPEQPADPDTSALSARTVLGLAVAAGVLSAADGWLIYATRAGGLALKHAAKCLGLTYAAACKRRQRSERRSAAWWDPDHRRRPTGERGGRR